MFRNVSAVAALPVALFMFACGEADRTEIGALPQPIVGGTADLEHDAVVSVVLSSASGGGLCSGTIVSADPVEKVGYVLTAAHCLADGLDAAFVLVGEDAANASAFYSTLGQLADSGFPSKPGHDLGLVRIVGVDETTPVVPLIDPGASVAVGDPAVVVGYGETVPNEQEANTQRHRLDMTVKAATDGEIVLAGLGDACSGDSGGPVLVGASSEERVAAVSNAVDASCFLTLDASLVRPTFDEELRPFLEEAVPMSCDRCVRTRLSGAGSCVDVRKRCDADDVCTGVRGCVSRCGADSACAATCVTPSLPGVALYLERAHCVCAACAAECNPDGGETVCPKLPSLDAAHSHGGDVGTSGPSSDGGGCSVAVSERGMSWSALAACCAALGLGFRRRARRRPHVPLRADVDEAVASGDTPCRPSSKPSPRSNRRGSRRSRRRDRAVL